MTAEQKSYNALALTYRVSYKTLQNLWDQHGSWQAALAASHSKKVPDAEKAAAELDRLGIRIILQNDDDFPELLREIPWPPLALYVRGTLPTFEKPAVAIVGTRKATPIGLTTAEQFARELAGRGLPIISGLALGMDAAAHRGTLEARGVAVAVLASSVGYITPRTNAQLGEQILKNGGAIISEYPLGTESIPRLFLERNRIVSGLSKGVLVIEAPKRSGTLATARFAIEQNRDLFVVPGAITNPNYEGSHDLIKQGAQLVTTSADILATLGLETGDESLATQQLPFLDPLQQKIVVCLTENGEPMHTDALCEKISLDASEINEALALLTIANIVKESGGRYYI